MGEKIRGLLDAIDGALKGEAGEGERLDLYVFGRSALIRRFPAYEATKDVDVLRENAEEAIGLMARAVELFGEGTDGARRHGVYLNDICESFPPVPPDFRDRATPAEGPWAVVRVWEPDPHDLIISKLRRFHEGDRQDIRVLCDNDRIDPSLLSRLYDSVFWVYYKTEEGDRYESRRDTVLRYLREGVGL